VILADTSAWVEYDRATGSRADLRLAELLERPQNLAVTEPIIMEVTAGARDHQREIDLLDLLARATLIPFDAAADHHAAARIYRHCRAQGITPRGMIDCMIAAVATRSRSTILAHDTDLIHVAKVFGLSIDPASLGT